MTTHATDSIGAFEAKNNLGQLLDRVQRGETIVITRHGTPVAKLVPFQDVVDRAQARAAARRLLHFGEAEGLKLPKGITLKDLINEGRR